MWHVRDASDAATCSMASLLLAYALTLQPPEQQQLEPPLEPPPELRAGEMP